MSKLNQIIAVVNGKKSRAAAGLTEIYHLLQKGGLLDGISRTYHPKDDEGEQLPSESKKVQVRVPELVRRATGILSDVWDTVHTLDWTNREAGADVVVGGRMLAEDVPVTHLLFLEKQLVDLHTLIEKLPTLDPAADWEYNAQADAWASTPFETVRTKKVPRSFEVSPATDKHPAQCQVFTEDVVVGTWRTTTFSGAIPEGDKRAMLSRCERLQEAVKKAREEANAAEAVDRSGASAALLQFVFGNTQ